MQISMTTKIARKDNYLCCELDPGQGHIPD